MTVRSIRGASLAAAGMLAVVTLLAACATTAPPSADSVEPAYDPVALVAQVRASAGNEGGKDELAISPLRDPMVVGLRENAAKAEREGRYADAATALDQALAETGDDPAVLQERAEAALLNRDLDGAERFARQAHDVGAQVGPLCRRHWATVRVVRQTRGDTTAAAEAQRQLDACKVTAPPRY
jgi:Flp pilus assembly protein TadD